MKEKIKKALMVLLFGGFCMTGAFAKTVVVYFSCTGNTERLAKTAAKALDADLIQIIPEKAYTAQDLDWNDRASRSTKECNDPSSRPAIQNRIDVSAYDCVIIAYPIWWAYAPKIIYTFVESVDLTEKKVVPICTSGGSGLGSSGTALAKASGNGDWRKGSAFRSTASESELKKFFEQALK